MEDRLACISFEQLLDRNGSVRNLVALAKKGGVDIDAEMQTTTARDSELYRTLG